MGSEERLPEEVLHQPRHMHITRQKGADVCDPSEEKHPRQRGGNSSEGLGPSSLQG